MIRPGLEPSSICRLKSVTVRYSISNDTQVIQPHTLVISTLKVVTQNTFKNDKAKLAYRQELRFHQSIQRNIPTTLFSTSSRTYDLHKRANYQSLLLRYASAHFPRH